MNKSFVLGMVVLTAVVAAATVWLTKRSVQPPTAAGKKRLTIFLRFFVVEYVFLTALAMLSVAHLLKPRLLGVLGLANFVVSFLIMWAVLKRVPISDQDVSREQRLRAIKSSKVLIAFYVFALINGLLHVGELSSAAIAAGVAVNVLITAALIANLRKQQAKLNDSNQ
jgi:hypothetical protein